MNQAITIRQTLGLSQKELAELLAISCKRLSQFENETAVLPPETKDELNYMYRYMKLALTSRDNTNTLTDCVTQQHAIEKQLQENKKQRDRITTQMNKAERQKKVVVAKKRFVWLLAESQSYDLFIWGKKLEEWLKQSFDDPQPDIKTYRIQLSVLDFEKGRLELRWHQIQSEIEFLEEHPNK